MSQRSKPRIAIVGAGAVGLYYGCRLAKQGEDVSFLLRADYEAVRGRGIRLKSVAGNVELKEVKAYRSASEIGPVELVIVAWKATSNSALETTLALLVHSGTQVLTMQNGLGNCEKLAAIVGPERVLGGLCFVCLNRLSAGMVMHTAGGKISIGEWQPQPGNPRACDWVARFKAAGVPAELAANLRLAQWRKLVWNIPFNGLAIAEGGVTTDLLLAKPELEQEVRDLIAEVLAIAAAYGCEIDPGVIDFEVSRTRPMGAYRPSSMIDYLEGRKIEYQAIWGEPLRRAQKAQVPVPHLESLASRIRGLIS